MGAAAPQVRGVAQIGFHAQQAIEKLLKALLTAHGVEPEDQHSIGRLLDQVRRLDRETGDAVQGAASLTQYAVYYRYPPRVAGREHVLTRTDVLADFQRAQDAFPILVAAIERRLKKQRTAN
ncbi:MAG TPA: HEPN domain-containing protein [Longimicrobium sp.]|nr:HEPN domain-containing protein [Longimicrobium sp.]